MVCRLIADYYGREYHHYTVHCSGGFGVKFKGQLSGSGSTVGKIQVAAPSEEPPKEFLPAQSTLLTRLLETETRKHRVTLKHNAKQ